MHTPGSNLYCDTKIIPEEWMVVEIHEYLPKRPCSTEHVMICDKIKWMLRKDYMSDAVEDHALPKSVGDFLFSVLRINCFCIGA